MSNHLNKPSEELVLDLINVANARNFTLNQVNIRDPIAHAQEGKNTRAIAEGIPGSGYVGSDWIFYNRLDMNVAMPNNDVDGLYLFIPNDGPVDTYEVCDRLNKMFNYQIGPEDVVFAPVDSQTLPVEVTITAKSDSLAWTGSKFMTLVADRPMWGSTFSSFTLDGFQMPTGDVSALTDPTATANVAPTFVSGANLLFGSLPSGGFLKSTNSEIEVGITAREGDGSVMTVPDADNTYTLNLNNDATWKIILSAGLLAPGVALATLYDVCLVITRPDNTTYTLKLEDNAGTYQLADDTHATIVALDYVAADKSVVQVDIDTATIASVMNASAVSTSGAPLGLYTLRIQARRKNSVAPRVIATILAKAYNT